MSFKRQCPNRPILLQNHRGTVSRGPKSPPCGQVSCDSGRPTLILGAGAVQEDVHGAGRVEGQGEKQTRSRPRCTSNCQPRHSPQGPEATVTEWGAGEDQLQQLQLLGLWLTPAGGQCWALLQSACLLQRTKKDPSGNA